MSDFYCKLRKTESLVHTPEFLIIGWGCTSQMLLNVLLFLCFMLFQNVRTPPRISHVSFFRKSLVASNSSNVLFFPDVMFFAEFAGTPDFSNLPMFCNSSVPSKFPKAIFFWISCFSGGDARGKKEYQRNVWVFPGRGVKGSKVQEDG